MVFNLLKIFILVFTTGINGIDFDSNYTHKINKNIILNTANLLPIRGEIHNDLASQFILELNQIDKKDRKNSIVYIDSPGGSVDAGMRIMREIEKNNLDCIAHQAISMGFVIFQSCKNRYITEYSQLMQHQMKYGISGEIRKVENYVNFVKDIENILIEKQISRIGISQNKFNELVNNEWWIFGINALDSEKKLADKVVSVDCSVSLTKKNITIDKNYVKEIWSACPLIPTPIKVIQNKNYINNPFQFYV